MHAAVDPPELIDEAAAYSHESINRAEIVRIVKGGKVFPPISGESTFASA